MEYSHEDGDGKGVVLELTSATGVHLLAEVACTIFCPLDVVRLSALSDVELRPLNYPEVSTFRPQPYRDYPFPDREGRWPEARDWTIAEEAEAEAEYHL